MKKTRMRTGYTTGSCAAAATAAAAWILKNQQPLSHIAIDTPKGWQLTLDVVEVSFNEKWARCAIRKDSGDDPDITNGILVFSTVTFNEEGRFVVKGGKGVGTVTQKGLQVPVGQPAINPIPLQMIQKEIYKIYGPNPPVEVCIEIPEGEVLAKKTFNPRLGIEGGLSVLGTTGIVEPMSEEALKETILLEIKVRKEQGHTGMILVPGNMGEKQVKENFKVEKDYIVQMSNYLGWALECAVEAGFKRVLVAGHIGKLIKPSGGIFHTHNRISTTRMELFVTYLALMGMQKEVLKKIMACRTTDEATALIEKAGFEGVYQVIANQAVTHCEAFCFSELEIGFALFSMKNLLGKSDRFDALLRDL